MSRIDEALKRASEPRVGRPVAIQPARRVEGPQLDQYPLENGQGEPGDEALLVPTPLEPAPANNGHEVSSPVASPKVSAAPEGVSRVADDDRRKLVDASDGPGGEPTEQYRRLAAALHDVQAEQGLKTLLVTSALPDEGKTLTVVNLALTLSEMYGRRVLLIDADLRRPSVHRLLGLSNKVGLSDVLGSDRRDLPLVQYSKHLSVLPAGRPADNPLPGLISDKLHALLEQCASKYDWVLLDTPPVSLQSDSQLMARLTQAVVFVIRAGVTPHAAVDRAISELGRDCIVGTVLNGVEESAVPASVYYGDYHH